MSALAAGVVNALCRAGVSAGGIAWWWRRPRAELDGLPPRDALGTYGAEVLRLARDDAARLEEHVPLPAGG